MSPSSLKVAPINPSSSLPDIAQEVSASVQGTLDKVGMSRIEVPVQIRDEKGEIFRVPAYAEAFVNLVDPTAKGIHMSRLFLTLQQSLEGQVLDFAQIQNILQAFITSHQGISNGAAVRVSFDYMIKRPALKSDNTGWRSYPVYFAGSVSPEGQRLEMGVKVTYSSTCPCSAALARQLIQDKFQKDFSQKTQLSYADVHQWLSKDSSILATPHSQRSYADVRVAAKSASEKITLLDLIDSIEGVLKTPVQAAVKREDEQEFALLNGQNLMFCEDAARRMKAVFEKDVRVADYYIQANHVESLHPHDAVSIVTKGIKGGFVA